MSTTYTIAKVIYPNKLNTDHSRGFKGVSDYVKYDRAVGVLMGGRGQFEAVDII